MLISASVADIRAAEEPLLAAGVPLMRQAAHAVADAVIADGFAAPASVALLVGAGNNGGDALWAGSFLAARGFEVVAYLVGDAAHEAGLAALLEAGGGAFVTTTTTTPPLGSRPHGSQSAASTPGAGAARTPIASRNVSASAGAATALAGDESRAAGADSGTGFTKLRHQPVSVAAPAIAHSDVVIDGILGIGASGGLRGVAGELVSAIASQIPLGGGHRPWVVAVDGPSGITLDGDAAGQVPGPVLPANHTITFGAPKPGMELPPASHLVGKLSVVDLGFELPATGEVRRLTASDVQAMWPMPGPADQKYTRGVVGVVAGTARFPGAAVLCASAAVGAGAGMVRYLGPPAVAQMVVAARPEVVPAGGQVQAWVLGPGVPTKASGDPDDGQVERIQAALAQAAGTLPGGGGAVPAVVDAGALPVIVKPLPPWVVLTPHSGELATLLSAHAHPTTRAEVDASQLASARLAHQLTGATVLLKGSTTLVVGPQGLVYSQADAPAWLATAGAGDVLAGLLGAMLAARAAEVVKHPELASEIAAAAAPVHGQAAASVNPGGPISALQVTQAIPTEIAKLLSLNNRG